MTGYLLNKYVFFYSYITINLNILHHSLSICVPPTICVIIIQEDTPGDLLNQNLKIQPVNPQ